MPQKQRTWMYVLQISRTCGRQNRISPLSCNKKPRLDMRQLFAFFLPDVSELENAQIFDLG